MRPGPALVAFGSYLSAALLVGGHVPLVERRMFEFPSGAEPMVAPLFRADGVWASPWSYTGFGGVRPEDVDVAHQGYRCTVQQHFSEQQAWIAAHPAAADSGPGPVVIEVGVVILSVGPEGKVYAEDRVDARGTAWPVGGR